VRRVASRLWWTIYPSAVAIFAGFGIWLAARRSFTIYNFDDWKLLYGLFSKPFVEWLLTPQNGHLMPATLYLFHLDYAHFGGRSQLLLATSLLLLAAAIACLYAAFHAGREAATPASRAVFAYVIFAHLWGASLGCLLWGLGVVNLLTALLAFASIWLMIDHGVRRARGNPERPPHRLWLAALAAFGATFSFGTGFGTWFSLLAIAIVARSGWKTIGGLAAATSLSLGLYLYAISDLPSGLAPEVVVRRPLEVLEFAASFVGAAVGRVAQGIGGLPYEQVYAPSVWAGGAGALGLACFALWLWLRPSRVTPRALLGIGLMIFPFAVGVVTAMARLELSPLQGIQIRFIVWSAFFWMGAACAVVSLPPFSKSTGVAPTALALSLPLLSLLMLPALRLQLGEHDERQRQLARGSLALIAGVRSDTLVRPLSPMLPPEVLYTVADRLERDRRAFFAEPRAELMGKRLAEERSISEPGRCRGRSRPPVPLRTRGALAARASGTLTPVGAAAPAFIAITDPSGTVRGLGDVIAEGAEAAGGGSRPIPWQGVVADFDRSATYSAHAMLADGSACLLGRARRAPRR
jgi:hypothetical protein